jgi:hypothetical protein
MLTQGQFAVPVYFGPKNERLDRTERYEHFDNCYFLAVIFI